jgi:uncharacterized protein YbjT (DUF2867 family)
MQLFNRIAIILTLVSVGSSLKLSKTMVRFASSIVIPTILASPFPANADNIVVLGGSGFVGSRVVHELVDHGDKVTSISKSGAIPSYAVGQEWTNKVNWVKADLLLDPIDESLKGADAVVSCVGAIGFDEVVVREGNADANVKAVQQAKTAGSKKFVYVSVSDIVPEALGGVLPSYFESKAIAEDAVKSAFPSSYTLVKPSFIYGGDEFILNPPRVASFYGSIVDSVLSSGPFRALASVSPALIKVAIVPPVSVEHIAQAIAASAVGLSTSSSLDGADAINGAAKLMGHF